MFRSVPIGLHVPGFALTVVFRKGIEQAKVVLHNPAEQQHVKSRMGYLNGV